MYLFLVVANLGRRWVRLHQHFIQPTSRHSLFSSKSRKRISTFGQRVSPLNGCYKGQCPTILVWGQVGWRKWIKKKIIGLSRDLWPPSVASSRGDADIDSCVKIQIRFSAITISQKITFGVVVRTFPLGALKQALVGIGSPVWSTLEEKTFKSRKGSLKIYQLFSYHMYTWMKTLLFEKLPGSPTTLGTRILGSIHWGAPKLLFYLKSKTPIR